MSLHKTEAMTVLLEYVDIGTHVLAKKINISNQPANLQKVT